MKNKILTTLFLFSTFNIYAQWSYLGLGNTITADLSIYSDTIYASTNNGIYKKHIFSTDTLWAECGLQGEHIVQTLVPNYQTFICVVEISSTNTTQIYKSSNGGATFSLLNADTSNFCNYLYLDHIAHPEDNYDTLYFLNHQLRTFDGGITWDTIFNIASLNNNVIKVNPENHSQLLIGGETNILEPYIQTSFDYGDNWTMLPLMHSFFPGDNAVHDIIFNGNEWFALGEGVIGKSSDGGNNWVQLLNVWSFPVQWCLYFFDIEFSPIDKNKLYVSGANNDGKKAPLLYSDDQGVTWDTLSYESVISRPDITTLAIKNNVDGDNIFLGGNGVYSYKNIGTGIAFPSQTVDLKIFPNPVNNILTLSTDKYISHIIISDILGHQIISCEGKQKINVEALPPGVYFITAITDQQHITSKLIKY